MARNTEVKSDDKMRGGVAVALMLLLTIGALSYFMPRESKFGYEYELYRPWRYSPLIATYDFPIYKTEEAVMAEQDSLMETIMPYYNYNPDEEKVQIEKFKQDFAGSIPHSYINIISDRLHRL